MALFSLPTKDDIDTKLVQLSWNLGLFGTHKVAIPTSQAITYRSNSPVAKYTDIEQITVATNTLKWTADPWNGKLDVIKHPTFMQEAIDHHPDFSGDCDDFAAYWVVALLKNKLADEAFLACFTWRNKPEDWDGHCVCVFRVGNQWYWVSCWGGCKTEKIDTSGAWVDRALRVVNRPLVVAGYYDTFKVLTDDTLLVGNAHRLR